MSNEKLGCVLLCRMGSRRLPGKTMAYVGDKPLLWYLVERLRGVTAFEATPIIATSDQEIDQPIADWAQAEGLPLYRGSQEDVCDRFLKAAQMAKLDVAFRVNGDSPFTDSSLLDKAARIFADKTQTINFVTNLSPRSFPYGVAVEGVRVSRYEESLINIDPMVREHVTSHIYKDLPSWHYQNLRNEDGNDVRDDSAISVTIDTPPQLEEMRKFIEAQVKPWQEISYIDAVRYGGFN